jgi:hypothetical protein
VRSSLWDARYRTPRAAYPELRGLRLGRRAASRLTALLLLGLAPGSGYLAARLAASAGGLLHRRFTLTDCSAYCFCGPMRQVTPPRVLPDATLYGVRTFLDPVYAGPRPPGQPGGFHITIVERRCQQAGN